MSAEFLASILKIENSIRSSTNQPCCVCLQDFGTLSPETGVIECGVRLPCSHCVGSACIATWFSTNNTCPLCRRVFFPAQPRPHLEHANIAEDASHRDERRWREICTLLRLSNRACAFGFMMWNKLRVLPSAAGHSLGCLAGAVIYMVTHILGEPKSPEVIAHIVRVETGHLKRFYAIIYPSRHLLVTKELFEDDAACANMQGVFAMLFNGATLDEMLALLPTPTGGTLGKSEGPSMSDQDYDEISRREHMDEEIGRCCTQLGHDQSLVAGFINLVSQDIAHKIRKTMFRDLRSPKVIIAVSIYMASHLLRVGESVKQISKVVDVSERTFRSVYESVYPRRLEFVESRVFLKVSPDKALQALAWPALS